MGNACKKSKVRDTKRKDMDELYEREQDENENENQEPEEISENKSEEVEPEGEEEEEEEEEEKVEEEEVPVEAVTPKPTPTQPISIQPTESKSDRGTAVYDKVEEKIPSEVYSESEHFEQVSEKVESSIELTLSTEATGAVQVTKLNEPAHEESIRSTYRSVVTPCDMDRVDETAQVFSKNCGCYLGEKHDENNCKICRKIDLSDTPLLN